MSLHPAFTPPCAVEGCAGVATHARGVCDACWARLPVRLCTRIAAAWHARLLRGAIDGTLEEHQAAIADAVRTLEGAPARG